MLFIPGCMFNFDHLRKYLFWVKLEKQRSFGIKTAKPCGRADGSEEILGEAAI
jgi:hypothetical protein